MGAVAHHVSQVHAERAHISCVARYFYFSAKAGHVAGTRLAGRTRRAREYYRSNHFPVPTYVFFSSLLKPCM